MRGILIRWLVTALSLLLTAYIIEGIQVRDFSSALVAALVLGIVNALIRPIFLILTLPINILTLGLFTLVINAAILLIVARTVKGFSVTGFWPAFLGAIVLSLISTALNALLPG